MVRQNNQYNTVKSLRNDYVYEADSQMKAIKKQKIGFRRRMVVFGIIATVVITMLAITYVNKSNTLAEKQKIKHEVEQKLQLAKDKHEMLTLQIEKLQDDDYIAKLARKEYFLSEDGEIIFTIPNEDDKE